MQISTLIRYSVCASAFAIAAAGSASAAIVTMNSVAGQWSAAAPDSNVSGLGTNTILWGKPNADGNGEKSSYSFDSAVPPAQELTEETASTLGTFTHTNNIIDVGTAISEATLDLTFGLTIDGVSQTISNSYNFSHWETPNSATPCANGESNDSGVNANGCADRVQATLNKAVAETFTINGTEYTIDITGFNIPDQDGIPTFWTVEKQTNSAQLYASLTELTPAPVPLPAAGWMLIASLGGLAVTRRRKKAA